MVIENIFITQLLLWILWTLIIFFVTRWFWLWYFKINRRSRTLENIEEHLYDIKLLLQGKDLEEEEEEDEDNYQPPKKWRKDVDAINSLLRKE